MTRQRSNAVSGGRAPFIGAKPSQAPIIGSHRERAPIGDHRAPQQEPTLNLQQSIGNQATQELGSNYGMYATLPDEQLAPETPIDAGTSAPTPVPPGYSSYSVPVPMQMPSSTESGDGGFYSGDGGFYSGDDVHVGGGSDTVAEDDDSYSDGVYGGSNATEVEPRPKPSLPPKRVSDSGLEMEPNKEVAFDQTVVPKGTIHGVDIDSTTFYADESQRAQYGRSFDKHGKMKNKTDGSSLNTIGSERAAVMGSRPDRHIFVMDEQGGFHSNDAIKENRTRSKQIKDDRKAQITSLADEPEKQEMLRNQKLPNMERFHHTSFLAGQDVAGAGEMQVRDGQVELVSDASGHYMPESRQMMQTVKQLQKNKVSVEQLGVEFIGKPQFEYETDMDTGEHARDEATGKKIQKRDEHGNKIRQRDAQGRAISTKNMQASAMELLGYENHTPDTAEEQMREMHGKKDGVLKELLSKVKRIEPIPGVRDKKDAVMQELLATRGQTAPTSENVPSPKASDGFGQYRGNNDIFDVHNLSEDSGYTEVDENGRLPGFQGGDDSYYDDDGAGVMEGIVDRGYTDIQENGGSEDNVNHDIQEEDEIVDRGYGSGYGVHM
ncbi:hypothetical protein ACFPPD_18595 [Cohnella suwonensis]|uniref:Uncharacterized protein n=1 Tax=Cohnella suwonensis TaxID=696072 RepID=A0ABW0M1M1_9BACL